MARLGANLLANLPDKLSEEFTQTLADHGNVRIEHIVSTGQASPDGFWYDQTENEWVAVLQGEAKLLIEGDDQPMHLVQGDTIHLPAHCRHRVEWTTPQQPTVWLAVFY